MRSQHCIVCPPSSQWMEPFELRFCWGPDVGTVFPMLYLHLAERELSIGFRISRGLESRHEVDIYKVQVKRLERCLST